MAMRTSALRTARTLPATTTMPCGVPNRVLRSAAGRAENPGNPISSRKCRWMLSQR